VYLPFWGRGEVGWHGRQMVTEERGEKWKEREMGMHEK